MQSALLAGGLVLAAVLAASAASPATADDMNELFRDLKVAPDRESARAIEDRIWQRWFESGNAEVDALMEQAMAQRDVYDFAGALETLDRISAILPDYAEAWNQRAGMHFYREEYDEALEAVARTLELEPRHFGALGGRAVIRLRQSRPALARQNLLEAMQINPWQREREFFPDIPPPVPPPVLSGD